MSLFDIENEKEELLKLEKETLDQNFWNDNNVSSKILFKIKKLKDKVNNFDKIKKEVYDAYDLNKLLLDEFDEDLKKDILISTKDLISKVDKLELETFLSNKYDTNNAIITIHPGAGGTESQDWAEM